MSASAQRTPTIEDYNAGRLFCDFSITVNDSGVRISASKQVRIHHSEPSHVSVGGYYIRGAGHIPYVRLGEVMCKAETPLHEKRGIIVDYIENYAQAASTAAQVAEQWRNELITELSASAERCRTAPIYIEE